MANRKQKPTADTAPPAAHAPIAAVVVSEPVPGLVELPAAEPAVADAAPPKQWRVSLTHVQPDELHDVVAAETAEAALDIWKQRRGILGSEHRPTVVEVHA